MGGIKKRRCLAHLMELAPPLFTTHKLFFYTVHFTNPNLIHATKPIKVINSFSEMIFIVLIFFAFSNLLPASSPTTR